MSTPVLVSNAFAAGPAGTSLTAGVLGSVDGMPWDNVTITAGSTLTYDTTHAHSGLYSAKITTTSGVACHADWMSSGSLPSGTQFFFRLYLYMETNPATQHQLWGWMNNGTRAADLVVTSTGTLIARNTSGATILTTTATVPLNQWFRVEGFCIGDASVGQVEIKLFSSAESTTATETQTTAASQNTSGLITQARFGLASGGVTGLLWWMAGPAVSATAYVGPGPVLQNMAAGAPTTTGFTVKSKPVGGSSVRLKVATDQALTQNVTWLAAQAPDQYGYASHTATGLTAGTTYYCCPAATPNGGTEALVTASGTTATTTGRIKTLPASGVPANFRVALASCVNTSLAVPNPNSAIDDWVTWNADLNVFTGDFDYEDSTAATTTGQLGAFENQADSYGGSQGTQMSTAWGYYCASDHDTGPDNGDSDTTWMPENIAARQEMYPFGVLGDTTYTPVHGLYQTWVAGRVRFIMIDQRNLDRSPGAAVDNASKTMLGSAQLAWFYQQLTQPEPLKVVVGDSAWMGNFLGTDLDKWWSYNTERQAIISFVNANKTAVRNIMWWHGDDHCVAVATPAANTWGGWPVYCAAPLRQTGAAIPNVAATFTSYYNNSGGDCRLYGRISFNDNGSQITVSFQGWDAVNQVAQVTQTDVFSAPAATGAGIITPFPV